MSAKNLTEQSLFALGEHCPNLVVLNIEGGSGFTSRGVGFLTERCPKLERIEGIRTKTERLLTLQRWMMLRLITCPNVVT